LAKTQRWNTLVSFKLAGTNLRKLDEYCISNGFSRSDLMRQLVDALVSEKAPKEEEPVGG